MQNIKNIELLAPAGSFDAMLAAVANGANAIYLGGNAFSARALATNFTNDEIVEAVRHCHLYNVKVYVAVNVLYSDDQFDELISYIDFLYLNQVDAIIIQDIGLVHLVKNRYPDFEVHISTQASVTDIEGVNFFKNLGVQRVVLARENTLEEIAHICNETPLDIEVFVHGALCMSYSGQCLFSSLIAKRSGNKGSCGQPCRLNYHLLKEDKKINDLPEYLLSPKDLCSIEHVGELLDAGITSFKIEGRMKRPEYVASIVRQYRKAIDQHLNNKKINYNDAIYEMKSMFNRGFTSGHIKEDHQFLAKEYPGHVGHLIGEVISIDKSKKRITIKLKNKLKQQDRILLKNTNLTRTITKLYLNNQLVNEANNGDLVQIEMNEFVKNNDHVYLTYEHDLIKRLQDTFTKNTIKFPINMNFIADVEKNIITLQLKYNDYIVEKSISNIIEKALNTPLTNDRIEKQLSKLGDSVYCLNEPVLIEFEQGYTFPIKELNQLRRECIALLDEKRIHIYNRIINVNNLQFENKLTKDKEILVKVHTIEQYRCLKQHSNITLFCSIDLALTHLLEEKEPIHIFTSFLTSDQQIDRLINSRIFKYIEYCMIGNLNSLSRLNEKQIIIDRQFNLYNSYALDAMKEFDCIMSLETTRKQLNSIRSVQNIYTYVYGYVETMHLKHCIISNHYYGKKIRGCNKCKEGTYSLSDRTKSTFKINTDIDCNNIIYHDRPIFVEDINSLQCNGIVLNFTYENAKEIIDILDFYINYDLVNNKKTMHLNLITKGYLGK